MRNILVIRFSAMGDILLTTPIIARLRKVYPDAHIHFLVRDKFREVAEACADIDEIHTWNEGESIWQVRGKLGLGQYDAIIDLQSNLKSRLLSVFLKAAAKYRYKKPYWHRILLVHLKKNKYPGVKQISERYMDAIAEIAPGKLQEQVSLKREKLPRALEKFVSEGALLIAPGARWFTKTWPREYFASLASKILEKKPKARIVWVGGNAEGDIFEFLRSHPYLRRHAKRMVFLQQELSIAQLAQLADRVDVSISNDSGLMHLLSTSRKPLIALFLSTVAEFGFYPLGENTTVLAARDISCRPCNHKGLPACPKKHFKCGFDLTADEVYARLVESTPNS